MKRPDNLARLSQYKHLSRGSFFADGEYVYLKITESSSLCVTRNKTKGVGLTFDHNIVFQQLDVEFVEIDNHTYFHAQVVDSDNYNYFLHHLPPNVCFTVMFSHKGEIFSNLFFYACDETIYNFDTFELFNKEGFEEMLKYNSQGEDWAKLRKDSYIKFV